MMTQFNKFQNPFDTALGHSVQFNAVTQSCPTLCDPMNHSTPGLPVHHQLLEFTQTHVHRVGDPAISSTVVPFSSCPQSLPASGSSFPMSQLFSLGGQSIGVSVYKKTIQTTVYVSHTIFGIIFFREMAMKLERDARRLRRVYTGRSRRI